MRRDGQLTLGGFVCMAILGAAPGLAMSRTSPPSRVRTPDAARLLDAYPAKPLQAGAGGQAVRDCVLQLDGKARDCKVNSEAPADLGFGAAALSLAPYFPMSPATRAGVPVAGGVVKIPIVFRNDGRDTRTDTTAVLRLSRSLNRAQQPSGAEVAAFAGADGRDQTVSLQCDFGPDGRLRACQPLIRGAPQALEAAALKLTGEFIAEPGPKPSLQAGDKVDVAIPFAAHPLSEADLTRAPPLQTFAFDYARRPAAADLALPDAAVKAGRATGWAALQCTVADRGALTDCAVSAEEAPGLGLGAAAIRAVGHVAVATWNSLGDSTLGRRINLRIVLAAPAPAAASPAAPAN